MDVLAENLRPLLTPITHNLPAPVVSFGASLIGEQCYSSLVHDINLADTDCLKLALSKGLGIGIIGASSVVKIPQLLKLLNSRSAEGISFLSYLLETSSFLVSLVYNYRNGFPISTYGELGLIACQNVAISVLVLQYSGRGTLAAVFLAGLAAAAYALLSESITPMSTLQIVQASAGVVGVASKLPQIITIFREGGTGQLSAFAVFNYLAGSLSRIFTTLQEVDDSLILYGYVSGFLLNAVLAIQMIYYWNSSTSKSTVQTRLTEKGHRTLKDTTTVGSNARGTVNSKHTSSTPSTRRRG